MQYVSSLASDAAPWLWYPASLQEFAGTVWFGVDQSNIDAMLRKLGGQKVAGFDYLIYW